MANKRKSGKREPNGRVSRKPEDRKVRDQAEVAANEWDTMGVGLMARWRVHKVEPKSLRDQRAGSLAGRYVLQGLISDAQYDAAMTYLEEREEYMRCIAAPRQPGAVDLNATKGQSVSLENVARSRRIQEDFNASRKAMGKLWGAVDAVLVWEVDNVRLLGDFRTALNELVRRYSRPVRLTQPAQHVHVVHD